MKCDINKCLRILMHQLDNWWPDYDKKVIEKNLEIALMQMEINYEFSADSRLYKDGEVVFYPLFSSSWAIFLYRISRLCAKDGHHKEADMLYYLNKIMHSVDWYHGIDLPKHFGVEHPLGSVLGRAKYSDFLFVYQGTTIGGSRKEDKLFYPQIGEHVVMYANSTILGNSKIGKNVVVSANAYIKNEIIPDNCIVFGTSPNLIIKKKPLEEMKGYFSAIWNS